MVPDIQSETNRIFCHFRPFFVLLPPIHPPNDPKKSKCLEILSFYTYMYTINEHHMIYGLWNVRCDRQKFFSFRVIFCPSSLLTTWKIKILKLKKAPEDIIILHICTIHDNHRIYVSWDMKCDEQNFLSFWTVFCPFTSPPLPHYPPTLPPTPLLPPLKTIKNQNSSLTAQKLKKKNEKKLLEISAFYNGVPKIMIICYTLPEILHITDDFGLSFAILPS